LILGRASVRCLSNEALVTKVVVARVAPKALHFAPRRHAPAPVAKPRLVAIYMVYLVATRAADTTLHLGRLLAAIPPLLARTVPTDDKAL